MKLTLWLPMLPRLPNRSRGLHWAIVRREKADCYALVKASLGRRRPSGTPWPKARATFTRVSLREPDTDNLAASMKAAQDALIRAGLIEDDKPSKLEAVYRWRKAKRRDDQGVRVEVGPAA